MIKCIIKIKNCPSFIDFKPASDLPEFKKYNLIYGWNGSGKTSFSRILRSFELGENYYNNPEKKSEFIFDLDNEISISHNELTTFKNIRVFNKDFIDDSVFGIGGPKPIFFLGKESKEDKEKIISIEDKLGKLRPNLSVSLRINQSYIFKSYIFSMLCCHFVPPNFRNTIYHNIVDI